MAGAVRSEDGPFVSFTIAAGRPFRGATSIAILTFTSSSARFGGRLVGAALAASIGRSLRTSQTATCTCISAHGTAWRVSALTFRCGGAPVHWAVISPTVFCFRLLVSIKGMTYWTSYRQWFRTISSSCKSYGWLSASSLPPYLSPSEGTAAAAS